MSRQSWVERHKVFRRGALLWAVWLITHVTLECFNKLDKVTAPVATALTAVVGILTVVVGMYQGSRHKEDSRVQNIVRTEGPSEADH